MDSGHSDLGVTQSYKGKKEAKGDWKFQFKISQPSPSRSGSIGGTTMADHEDHAEWTSENHVHEEQSTFGFPIVNSEDNVQMKNISPSTLLQFHGKVYEDPYSFLFKFDILCWSYDYSSDAQKVKLFHATLKDSAFRWFMGLEGNTISCWDQMRRPFLNKYQEYCKIRETQDEIFIIVQGDDETLDDYLERFLYILQRSKHKFDLSNIRTLFLGEITEDSRHNLNLLGQGDIFQKTFEQICDLCRKFSRNQSRSTRGGQRKNNKLGSTNAMIIVLENKMDNMKIEIMNTISKQIESLKFQQKLEKKQE